MKSHPVRNRLPIDNLLTVTVCLAPGGDSVNLSFRIGQVGGASGADVLWGSLLLAAPILCPLLLLLYTGPGGREPRSHMFH